LWKQQLSVGKRGESAWQTRTHYHICIGEISHPHTNVLNGFLLNWLDFAHKYFPNRARTFTDLDIQSWGLQGPS